MPATKQRYEQVSRSGSDRTPCGTALRRTCWRPTRTYARSSSCWDISVPEIRRSICMYLAGICKRRLIRWIRSRSGTLQKTTGFSTTSNDTPTLGCRYFPAHSSAAISPPVNDMEFSGCTDDWVSGFRRMVRQCPCHFVSSWTRSSPSCDLVEKTRRVRSGVTERPSDRLYGAGATSTAIPVSNE